MSRVSEPSLCYSKDMALVVFTNFTSKDKAQAVEKLIKGSTPSQDFFLMIILSILTAAFGLLLGSTAIIVGSMLIAPMLYPMLSLSLGITMADFTVISRSFWTIIKSVAFGILAAAVAAFLFSSQFPTNTAQIEFLSQPSLASIVIAIIAGLAASFAFVKPQLNETLPGVAISVSLIPPIAVTGIGIARFDLDLISGSFLLFLANTVGVVFASMVTFSLMHFYTQRTRAELEIAKEERKLRNTARLTLWRLLAATSTTTRTNFTALPNSCISSQ